MLYSCFLVAVKFIQMQMKELTRIVTIVKILWLSSPEFSKLCGNLNKKLQFARRKIG